MPTTDKELAKLQSTVEKKRQQLADVRLQRASLEAELNNDIVAAQLRAEEEQLDALLAEEKSRSTQKAVTAGAAVVIDPAAAQAAAEAAHERAINEGTTADAGEEE